VKTVARLFGCDFRRFQCAVDSQPADIIGFRIWDPEQREFVLRKGPIFTNIMLVDEINRLPPKSQSAFIEALGERQATIDGTTFPLGPPFFSIATQNPYEREGVFPLIEAQKDRFMFSTLSRFLGREAELEIVKREMSGMLDWKAFYDNLSPVTDHPSILAHIASVKKIHMEDPVLEYITDLVLATRSHSDVEIGSSARGSIALVRGSRAIAALDDRNYVIPDDVKKVAPHALAHRIVLRREALISGISSQQVIGEVLNLVEVP
jgi:MoxR-like ATPase